MNVADSELIASILTKAGHQEVHQIKAKRIYFYLILAVFVAMLKRGF